MDSLVLVLILPYVCWSAAYFFCSLLTPKKNFRYPGRTLFLICLPSVSAAMALKLVNVTVSTVFTQALFICIVLFFFEENIMKKAACYLIYVATVSMVELVTATLLAFVQPLWTDSPMAVRDIYRFATLADSVFIGVVETALGVFFLRKEVKLLKRCFSYLNLKTFLLLLLPVFLPTIAEDAIIHLTEYKIFPLLAAAYWLLCLFTYPLFLKGLKTIKRQDEEAVIKEKNLKLLKEQLSFSKELQKEYDSLRKWNHDVENHLLSLSYLMDMERYQEADSYCHSIISAIASDHKIE
ncbi:MAG: hypothetical protein SOY73_06430 [Blautia sp.]|nr:hypothetical protein [Blautia sp.]